MRYRRMRIEVESPEQLGYTTIRHNLAESSFSDMALADFGVDADLGRLVLPYGDHLGAERLRELIAANGPGLSPSDVLVTAGAAAALFIIATSLLQEGAHALVVRSQLRNESGDAARYRRPTSRHSSCGSRTAGSSTSTRSRHDSGRKHGS